MPFSLYRTLVVCMIFAVAGVFSAPVTGKEILCVQLACFDTGNTACQTHPTLPPTYSSFAWILFPDATV